MNDKLKESLNLAQNSIIEFKRGAEITNEEKDDIIFKLESAVASLEIEKTKLHVDLQRAEAYASKSNIELKKATTSNGLNNWE